MASGEAQSSTPGHDVSQISSLLQFIGGPDCLKEENMASGEAQSSTPGHDVSQNSLPLRIVAGAIRKRWPKVENISTQTLHEWLVSQGDLEPEKLVENRVHSRKIVVLDTRPLEEFQVSHVKGAIQVCPDATDVEKTLSKIGEIASGSDIIDVVCYCSIGYRSTRYADALNSLMRRRTESPPEVSSIHGVYNLEGSLFKWADESRPMINMAGTPAKHVHPYNVMWGVLLRKELHSYAPVL